MPTTILSEPINRFYYGFLQQTPECLSLTNGRDAELEKLMVVIVRLAFTAGARWELRESAKLSPHIARFLEMCVLLGPDYPHDAWLADAHPDELTADAESWPMVADEIAYQPPVQRDDIPF